MKRLLTLTLLAATILLSSCASHKRMWYLQDAQAFTPEQIIEQGQIRIQPHDRLTIVVNSKDPELAAPFNSATGLSALSKNPAASYSSGTQALQVLTVDEKGCLEMPIIGSIECKDKTRSNRMIMVVAYPQDVVAIEGENVAGEQFMEYHVDPEDLDRVVLKYLYAPKK